MSKESKTRKVELGNYQVNGKYFPKHWGKPPLVQTRDYKPLPQDYGMGSSSLAIWIDMNLKKDKTK